MDHLKLRLLEAGGITFQGRHYNSPELNELRRETTSGSTFEIKTDPASVDHIWVKDPRDQSWMTVRLIWPSTHWTASAELQRHLRRRR